MPGLDDRTYLRSEQYRDSSNLAVRMLLHQRFSINRYGWHRWVFDQLELPGQAQVLEVGCGPGKLWRENIERVPWSWRVLLSDFSAGMARETRAALPDARFSVAVADVQSLAFADETFDAVIANHMLYHVQERQLALAEVRRVLKPGGRLYAATNGGTHLQELDALARRAGIDTVLGHEITFTLENGEEQLAPWFAAIDQRRYIDGLVLTEAAPLIDYLRSGIAQASLAGAQLRQLCELVEHELAEQGAIRISKDSGIFIAIKA